MNGIQMSITKYIKCRPQRPNKKFKILYLYRYVDFNGNEKAFLGEV
jgi:hypothetical protein